MVWFRQAIAQRRWPFGLKAPAKVDSHSVTHGYRNVRLVLRLTNEAGRDSRVVLCREAVQERVS